MKNSKTKQQDKSFKIDDGDDTEELISKKTHPKLIKEVTKRLNNQDLSMILSRLQDLEKAVYHVAGRTKEILERQEQLETVVVNLSTVLEEIFNGMEPEMQEEPNSDSPFVEQGIEASVVDDEETDELLRAWERKKISDLN